MSVAENEVEMLTDADQKEELKKGKKSLHFDATTIYFHQCHMISVEMEVLPDRNHPFLLSLLTAERVYA